MDIEVDKVANELDDMVVDDMEVDMVADIEVVRGRGSGVGGAGPGSGVRGRWSGSGDGCLGPGSEVWGSGRAA